MQIKDLTPRSQVSWPNLLRTNEVFWRREWEKHGNCSENKFDQFNYFKLALNIKDRLDILSVLSNAGFGPNPTALYNMEGVAMPIQNHIGQEPELRCVIDGNTMVLKEVGVCLDATGKKYISCPIVRNPLVANCQNSSFKLPLRRCMNCMFLQFGE